MAKNPGDIFVAQLTSEEVIRRTFTCNWVPSRGRSSVPAYVAITDTRLLVAQKFAMFNRARLALELGQVVEVASSGGLVPRVAVATVAGQGVVLSAVRAADVRALQEAVAAARGR